jgi:uncharacterized delta-60 repeat protein
MFAWKHRGLNQITKSLVERLEGRALLSAGQPDTSFSGDGKVLIDFRPEFVGASFFDLAVQSDGKVIAIGGTTPSGSGDSRFLLVRFTADGNPDPTFGEGGVVETNFGPGFDVAQGVALAPGGKIVAAGSSLENGLYELAVARYNSDGSLDTSFSDDGKRTFGYADRDDTGYDVAVRGDGRVVVAGRSNGDLLLGQLNANGTNDTSFSGDGLLRVDVGGEDYARAVAILSDGDVVAAGVAGTDFAAVRYNADGTPDNNFSGDGKATVSFGGGEDAASEMAVDSTGRLVLAGSTTVNGKDQIAVARLTGAGELDAGFSDDGGFVLATDLPATAGGVVVDSLDRVVVGGTEETGLSDAPQLTIAFRLTSTGTLDNTFETDPGNVLIGFPVRLEAIGLLPTGHPVFVSSTAPSARVLEPDADDPGHRPND